jgi:hypothetical protein
MAMTDPSAWEKFAYAHAPSLSEPVFIEGLIRRPGDVAAMIGNAVRTATRRVHPDFQIRAFRGDALDHRLTDTLTSTPSAGRHPAAWLGSVARDRSACVAISNLAAWDTDLAAWARSLIQPLLLDDTYDLPSPADGYSFVADQGWAPFAMYKDAEQSLVFHLGPAAKEVWVWSEDTADTGPPAQSPSGAAATALGTGRPLGRPQKYVLKPGDFICIPAGRFHVVRNLGPSVLFGITLYPANGPGQGPASMDDLNQQQLGLPMALERRAETA